MPTNLPQQYFETEKKLKTANTPEEKIAVYEELLSIIPKHKGTEKLRAQLKTKISKCRDAAQKKSSTAHHGQSHKVKKSGAGQVVFVGLPNSGKSSLINAMTGGAVPVGDFPYTTLEPIPIMMPYENIKVQLVDAPPFTAEYMEPWQPDLIKGADGVVIVFDLSDENNILNFGPMLDQLKEKKISFIPPHGQPEEENSYVYKKTLMVGSKKDLENQGLEELIPGEFQLHNTSVFTGEGIETLREKIFRMLGVIRVYSKIPGKKAEFDSPFTLALGSDVMDMAKTVHKDFSQNLKFARIWGKNAYDGQRVNRSHILEDEDIIELHI